jgi:hypothetical protein
LARRQRMGRQIHLAAQAGPPCGSQACRNDRNGYEHPILDLDPKDTESLNEHIHGRFLPAECKTANRKTYYFYIYDRAASVGGLFRSRRACSRTDVYGSGSASATRRRTPQDRTDAHQCINRSALLFFTGRTGVYSCCVRDVTNQGAGIRLEGLNVLPVDFDLSFDNFRTIRRCRLVWRDGDFVGVSLMVPTCTSP